MTRYELLIFNLINESTDHMTADQVFAKLRETCPGVSLATVYNNLKKLNEANLIRKVVVEGSPDRYDRIAKHDHLVCRKCGKLADVRFDDLTESLAKQLGNFGESHLTYDLKVYYVCPECRGEN